MCDHATMPLRRITPVPPRISTRSFPGTPAHISQARAFLAAVIEGFPAADEAVLLVSELAANACAHTVSGQPGGMFTVRAEVCAGAYVHAEVEDDGSAWDGNMSAAEPPHGLYLLQELSDDCGTRRGKHGWVTWFTIASPATRTAR
jgi:anti-sigma regulatory factor (Ser/Thr protein kinase)